MSRAALHNSPRRAALGASLALLAACTSVGPDYVAPTIALADSFVEGGDGQTGDTSRLRWWSDLHDPTLDALVARGLAQNLSISAAAQAVDVAQANARAAGGANQIGGDLSIAGVQTDVSADTLGLVPDTLRSATLSVGSALAGVERRQQMALAALEAAGLDTGSARLGYLSSVIGAYIDARYYQELLELTRLSIADNRRILNIVTREASIGGASDLDVAQARAQLAAVAARQPGAEAAFLANVYGIASLLSEPAAPLLKTLQAGAAQPVARTNPQIGTPANLLRNRPDLRAAERRYAAAVAAIGVAQARLYPTLALSGTVSAGGTVDGSFFGPSLTLPVFNRGALSARRDAAIATAQQAQTQWRATVIGAVQEVQTAQSAYRLSRRQVARLREAVAASKTAFDLTQSAYQSGAIELVDVLRAELAMTQTRSALAQAVQHSAASWLQLQIATGSGWAIPE